MDLQELQYLQIASNELSFAKTGERLLASRQAVSHAIRSLEKELGTTLFIRDGNKLRLTEAGRDASVRASKILALVNDMKNAYQPTVDEQKPLRILFMTNWMAYANLQLEDILGKYQGVRPSIAEEGLERCYKMILNERADIALVYSMKQEFLGCSSHIVGKTPFYALVSSTSELASKDVLTVHDLYGHELSLMSSPHFQYAPLVKKLEAISFDFNQISIISNYQTMLSLVKSRDAVAFISKAMLLRLGNNVRAIEFTDPELMWYIYVLMPNSPFKNASAVQFTHYLEGEMRKASRKQ